VNKIKKYYKSSVILIFFFIIPIIIINVKYVKKLYSINLILEKDVVFLKTELEKKIPITNEKKFLDNNYYSYYNHEIKTIFDSVINNTKNSNKYLIKIYELCEKFTVTNDQNQHHQKIYCLTTKPEFAPELIEKNVNNLWVELHKKHSYDPINSINLNNNNNILVKMVEKKITYTNNKIKNILKYSIAIIFLFVLFHLRKVKK
jgi:hypothetical protein